LPASSRRVDSTVPAAVFTGPSFTGRWLGDPVHPAVAAIKAPTTVTPISLRTTWLFPTVFSVYYGVVQDADPGMLRIERDARERRSGISARLTGDMTARPVHR
jgi:hypothetical protein